MTHTLKVLKRVSAWCFGLLLLISAFGLWYYLDGKEYLAGEEHHYIGTSTISQNELVILADTKNILPLYSISEITLLESGAVEITYDFFSFENYPFINIAPFSYFDTPIINTFYEARKGFYFIAGGFLLFIGLKIFFHRYPLKVVNGDKKLLNAGWYVTHPQYLFHRKQAPRIYSPQIVADINIKSSGAGIYAIRTWKYRKGYLYSAGWGQVCWENKILLANKSLSENNESGVYSCRLGVVNTYFEFTKDIIGIVSLSGEWMEHADGVLRAESCEILFLIVSYYHKAIASDLSAFYGVPIVITDNPINGYMNWLFSDNGLDCLKHNAKILKGETDGNKRARNQEREVTVKTSITDFSP